MTFTISPEADIDLLHIQDFIAENNPAAAQNVIRKIETALYRLGESPFMGHKREDLTSRNVRFWSVYSYVIIYEIYEGSIQIVRVLSSYRNIPSLL